MSPKCLTAGCRLIILYTVRRDQVRLESPGSVFCKSVSVLRLWLSSNGLNRFGAEEYEEYSAQNLPHYN